MSTAVREERKVLTAVFADVVGSTALAERLDPEDVKLVVGEAVARIVGEVEALGGGRGGVLVVAGDAGIGKSRLLNEEHRIRAAARARLVGVRQELRELRRPRRRALKVR